MPILRGAGYGYSTDQVRTTARLLYYSRYLITPYVGFRIVCT